MKIIAVMSMRNESDIVESWVRYYVHAVDHVIITNNSSVDGSGELLRKLLAEGLPLTVDVDNRSGFFQEQRMRKMMRRAFFEFQADWVLLLDADEFVVPPRGRTIREVFNELKNDCPIKLAWTTYVPTDTDPDEPNILRRITHRLEYEVKNFYKVMVPAEIGKKRQAVIMMGNHDIRINGKSVTTQDTPSGMYLAHFPVRSKEQLATKILVGWLATLARPNHIKGENYHWKLLFDKIFNGGGEIPDSLENMAINYLGGTEKKSGSSKLIDGAIEETLFNFSIRYDKDSTSDPLKVFARTAEEIASNCGQLSAQLAALQSSPKAAIINALSVFSGFFPRRE